MHQDASFEVSKTAFVQFFRFFIIRVDPSDLGGVQISLSWFIVVIKSKLKMFCDQGVKYYTKTASATQKITKVHFCLYLGPTVDTPNYSTRDGDFLMLCLTNLHSQLGLSRAALHNGVS